MFIAFPSPLCCVSWGSLVPLRTTPLNFKIAVGGLLQVAIVPEAMQWSANLNIQNYRTNPIICGFLPIATGLQICNLSHRLKSIIFRSLRSGFLDIPFLCIYARKLCFFWHVVCYLLRYETRRKKRRD